MPTDDSEVQKPDQRTRLPRLSAGSFGTALFLFIALPCFLSLFWTLGTPPNADSGDWYNNLRYNQTVVIEGQELKIKSQEQPPGAVPYVAQVTPEDSGTPTYVVSASIEPMGTDQKGRSLFIRCLLGGAISLGVGVCAALMAVFIGVTWGASAGYIGGRTDSLMMRIVDVLYGLPYLLLVVLLSVAVNGVIDNLSDGFISIPSWVASLWEKSSLAYIGVGIGGSVVLLGLMGGIFYLTTVVMKKAKGLLDLMAFSMRLISVLIAAVTIGFVAWWIMMGTLLPSVSEGKSPLPKWIVAILTDYPEVIKIIVLVVAIGGVSWLTMARVIRGQVLSIRTEPYIEAARAQGMSTLRIMRVHLLPNLIGPIVVYTTLAIPQAILQESFLSFLGIGITEPLASWGQLASEGIKELPALASPKLIAEFKWWILVFPCVLLGLTLLSLNFMGDAMRERFDPRSKKRGV